jgi:hypothetical protein
MTGAALEPKPSRRNSQGDEANHNEEMAKQKFSSLPLEHKMINISVLGDCLDKENY